jgi:hypothetical protein
MLTRLEVIQMKESALALLADPYPGEPYYQRLGQYLVGIDASAGYVYGDRSSWSLSIVRGSILHSPVSWQASSAKEKFGHLLTGQVAVV